MVEVTEDSEGVGLAADLEVVVWGLVVVFEEKKTELCDVEDKWE